MGVGNPAAFSFPAPEGLTGSTWRPRYTAEPWRSGQRGGVLDDEICANLILQSASIHPAVEGGTAGKGPSGKTLQRKF